MNSKVRLKIEAGRIYFKSHWKKGGKMTTVNYENLILVIVLPPSECGRQHFISANSER